MASEFFRVPLSTVSQPKFRLGTAAVDAMMLYIKGQKPESKRLAPELITRASTSVAEQQAAAA